MSRKASNVNYGAFSKTTGGLRPNASTAISVNKIKRGENEIEEVSEFQRKLNETARLAHENENIAGDVLDELYHQRTSLERAHEDLTAMEKLALSARGIIQLIEHKSNQKEYILKAIMIILFVIDFLLICIVIKNGGSLFSRN